MGKFVKEEWVNKINDEVKQIGDASTKNQMKNYWNKQSIYRLPAACVTDLNKKAYKPQTVSFGPYHHGEEHLQAMAEHKHQALLHFLKRSNKPLEVYIESLTPMVQQLKDSYNSLDAAWQQDTDAFLQLMILDGCFMLEILQKAASIDDSRQALKRSSSSSSNSISISISICLDGDDCASNDPVFSNHDDDYPSNDPVFSNHGNLHVMPHIKRDMLMIENQLPMMLLYNLLSVQNDKEKHEEEFIHNLILKFYNSINAPVSRMGKCLHVLDLYRKSLLFEVHHKKYQPPILKPNSTTVHEGNYEIIRSAMELHEAGVQFRKSETVSLKDISFRHGVLRLPHVIADDATESMFLNLIAFERFHVGAGNEVTSYIFFMDSIIDDAKDVSLLKSQGIIQNDIGSDKAVAKLFNSLSKDITLEPNSSLDIVHKNVNYYCKKPWNKWRANLIHTYFRNPWAILSVAAAIFLFALTITQTIYTIFPYYKSG